MLRDVVGHFLDSVTEREFDAPLLALLASQGFTDIHFIHGGFEFGKDVIAKKRGADGVLRQYAIQSKAGNINMAAWRNIRPQVEECEYNTRAHPHFDVEMPRVAVLITTGTFRGAAAVDAQEFRKRVSSRGLADFEVWDRQTMVDWILLTPELGLTGSRRTDRLLQIVASIRADEISEPVIERYSRAWITAVGSPGSVTAIEAGVIASEFRKRRRLDLASYTALHLLRAAWAWRTARGRTEESGSDLTRAAVRLFEGYAVELMEQAEPLLEDPLDLVRVLADDMAIVTYPAACLRLVEILSLFALTVDDSSLRERAQAAVARLVRSHPGTARPPSDSYAASVAPATLVAAIEDPALSKEYVRNVALWLLDRHDPEQAGLGLASADEPLPVLTARLLGGALEDVTVERRKSSYLATVVLDLLLVLECTELYDALLTNVEALGIVPTFTEADDSVAFWKRGGDGVWPLPRVPFGPSASGTEPPHHGKESQLPATQVLLLSAACRSRHEVRAWRQVLLQASE